MNSINFDNVWLLFIALPIIAVVAVPFAVAVRSDNRNGHNIASLVIHLVMAVLIAFAAAGTSIVTVITQTEVYVLADVSYSAQKNLDTVDGYIRNLRGNLPRNSKLGVISFGKDYELLTELGGEEVSVKTSTVDQTETNITEALEYAGTLFGDDVLKRIVVITDGKQSDMRDANSLLRTVNALGAKGITVDAIYLDDNISENSREIQVSGAEYTHTSFKDSADEKVVAYVQSSYNASNITVAMYSGETLVERRLVNLSLGSNAVSFGLPTDVEGAFDYRICIEGLESGEDECDFNNAYSFTHTVSGAVKVLVVAGNEDGVESVKKIYPETCEIDGHTVGGAKNVPASVEELCVYDEIVLVEADISKLNLSAMFVDSLDKVVSVFGKSLLTFGNLQIQGSDSAELAKLDDMLPVRYGDDENSAKLYTLVIDTSRSMELQNRMIMARQAAHQLVNFLSSNDEVCIVEFNGDVRVALTPTPVSRKKHIDKIIDELGLMNGTLIYKGLQEAYDNIKNLTVYSERQVMLITDGLTYSAESETDSPENIAKQMRADNIKLSCIDVGRGGRDTPEPLPDDKTANFLRNLSENIGRGDYFYAISPESLDKIMFSDIQASVTQPEIKEKGDVKRYRLTDDTLVGLEEVDDGKINGFINNSAKGSATTVLKIEYYNREREANVQAPLYAYWKYGNGRVATYTSGITKEDGWINKTRFLENVAATNTPSVKNGQPFTLSTEVVGKYAKINLTPAVFYVDATAKAEVTFNGQTEEYSFAKDSAGFYAEIPVTELGKYSVKVDYENGGETYTANTAINISYESEYDAFTNYDVSDLYKMVGGNGTVSEDGNLEIVNDDRKVGTYKYSLVMPLVAVCAALFVTDIIVRKLKWVDIKNLFVKQTRKGR